ncbi:uncharacterized protein LOC130850429 [Hippopotamus amphibius kiboko]|uniref:uncharacterized protein LOC130850429 n=1 Tax=Hippopotamus amphibius kiboko TaxID=575201 RepID=UPI0025953FC5|nr:uncharacterized protein LOC130850429 [Hippopotamus amphibius kiboko]XP_057585962.1 uncharacterized protein LOC130850429 [Hippopotamus amphibius kiboko]XP_057585963.1 uncharacterized protein LOC130850429 [Hippopotamus amphibius kiboko]
MKFHKQGAEEIAVERLGLQVGRESRIRAFAPNTCLGTLRAPLTQARVTSLHSRKGAYLRLQLRPLHPQSWETGSPGPPSLRDPLLPPQAGVRCKVAAAAPWGSKAQTCGRARACPPGSLRTAGRSACGSRGPGTGTAFRSPLPLPRPPRAALPLRSGGREQRSSGRAKLEGTGGKPSPTRARGPAGRPPRRKRPRDRRPG